MTRDLPMLADSAPDLEVALAKEATLLGDLGGLGSVLVAFSGGVDSTYVAWAAEKALGAAAVAVTGVSPSLALEARAEAALLAQRIGIRHELIATDEVADPRYLANAGDRCYWCKSELYDRLAQLAVTWGFAAVLDGTNQDDLADVRPGRRAAQERRVRSPLADAGLAKAEVRLLSRRAELPTWTKPASPCLASRIPHGTRITTDMLALVERAEEAVRRLGMREFRVRHEGTRGRVEVAPEELEGALQPAMAARIAGAVVGAGFRTAHVDDAPFRSGRLREESAPRGLTAGAVGIAGGEAE